MSMFSTYIYLRQLYEARTILTFLVGLITLKYSPEGNSSFILIKVMLCHTSLIFSFVNDKGINYIKLLNLGLVP